MAYTKTTRTNYNTGAKTVVKQNTTGNKNYSNYGYAYSTKTNPTTDATRKDTPVTYGGWGENASTGKFDDDKDQPTNTGGGSGNGSGGEKNKSATGYTGSWSANGLINDYMDYLNRQAEGAYNKNMGIVNDYYESALNNLKDNYDESVGILDRNNANNRNAINSDAENAMRQAYINNMLSRKSLQQAMTAQGLNGGATETTRASMENNYGNARNNIDRTRNKNLADLMMQYENNLAGLRQQLNSGMSDLDERKMNYSMQINEALQNSLDNYADKIYSFMKDYEDNYNKTVPTETGDEAMARVARLLSFEDQINNWGEGLGKYNLNGAKGMASAPNDYINTLQNIARNSTNFIATPTEVTNPYEATSMQQAGVEANSNYARMLQELGNLGANNTGAVNTSIGANRGVSSLEQILRALYGA